MLNHTGQSSNSWYRNDNLSEAPSSVKGQKRRNGNCPVKDGNERWGFWATAARQSSPQTALIHSLCYEAKRSLDRPRRGDPGNHFRFLKKLFPKCIFIRHMWYKRGVAAKPQKIEQLLSLRMPDTESRCSAKLRCVTLDQQEALPCPWSASAERGASLHGPDRIVTWQGRGRPRGGPPSVPLTIGDF